MTDAQDVTLGVEDSLLAGFDQAAVGIALAGLDGRFVRVNRKFEQIVGYNAEELRSLSSLDLTHPDDHAATRESLRRLLDGDASDYVLTKRYVRKDGSTVWSRTSVAVVRDTASRPRRFIGVIEDITRQVEVEEALRESEEFNRTIVESSRDCIKTLGLDGTLLWVSDTGLRMLCVPRLTDVIGKSWIDLWQGRDRRAAREAVQAAAAGEEARFVGRHDVDGREHWWDVALTPMRGRDGAPERLLAVSRDITERVAAEHERKLLLESERAARSAAEHASRLRDDFLATLSHELRTPLSAILGWVQILRRPASAANELSRGLDTIERNARAQASLIEELLDMSRIASGKLRLDLERVDAAEFVEAALETLRPAAKAKELRLETSIDAGTGAISGDAQRLQQVVCNLLSNAVKFTPRGGVVKVGLRRSGGRAEIVVSDTGAGISARFLPHLFERFRQADPSTTRRFGGLGLGLSIARHLVELHGGTIDGFSAGEGLGSTFTVRLPLVEGARGTAGAHEEPHARGVPAELGSVDLRGVKVLVVDDEPDGREIVARLLADCGAQTVAVRSALEALARLREGWPDVLITDIGMPDTDGFELLRRVRLLEQGTGYVPAIALTAFAREEDRDRALRAGFRAHLAKPIEPRRLLLEVASAVGRAPVTGAT